MGDDGSPGPDWSRVSPPWSEAEYDKATSDFSDWGQRAWGRYHLALAVGNGVGLLTFGGAILQLLQTEANKEAGIALLMPSCWLFVLGLMSAGLIPAIQGEAYAVLRRSLLESVRPANGVGYAWVKTAYKQKAVWLGRVEDWLGKIAAASFGFGLAYPLLLLSKRYLMSGSFLP